MPTNSSQRKSLWVLAVLVLAVLAWLLRSRISFDWWALARQLRSVSPGYVLTGVALLYFGYWLRSWRWAVLLAPVRRVRPIELLGPQLIGFTAVLLIGRIADLVRPYLIARRLGLPVATQLAVYSIERAFDLGAAAILFSLTLAVAPHDLPHHALYVRAGAVSLAATLAIVVFAISLRFAGETVAGIVRRLLTPLSDTLASRVDERIHEFCKGLHTLSTLREFLTAFAISMVMWLCIALGYLQSAHSFTADPTLAHFSFTATMLVVAASLGSSLLQLPILGWFTQIGVIATALHGFFNIPWETATACATVMFFVLNLDILPVGLIAARLQGTTLRQAVNESSRAEDVTVV
jgi:glycosyltransferase 2 family protein